MDKTRLMLFLKFLKFTAPYKNQWLAIHVLTGLGMLLSLIYPYLSKLVVDDALGQRDLKAFIALAVIGGGLFILAGALDAIKQFLDNYIKMRVNFDLNKKIFKQLQNFPFGWFQDKSTGEHLYKIKYDLDKVKEAITTVPPQVIALGPKFIFILAILFYLNWPIALLSLGLAPLIYAPPYYFSRRLQRISKILIENSQNILENLEETFSHIQLIKVFGRETVSIRRYLRKLLINLRIELKNIKLQIFMDLTVESVIKVIIALITFYSGYQVVRGELTLGGLTASLIYFRQLLGLQGQFTHLFHDTMLGFVSCQRLAEILDQRSGNLERPEAKSQTFKTMEIIFEQVSFGYRPRTDILRELSFGIASGRHIALVGRSGCGKTTLLNLIARLFDPQQGRLLIGGLDIKNLNLNSLKEQIGFTLQEPWLWNDSIENNIRYGREKATSEEIIQAAQLAGVAEFAPGLTNGYTTIVGENACKLSEGQKQKIAIARALIKNPKILILDEAMSAMDSASEERILDNIKENFKAATLITVSHRLSTVLSADLAYYFLSAEEMLIERPQILLENNERFSDLFAGQKKILI